MANDKKVSADFVRFFLGVREVILAAPFFMRVGIDKPDENKKRATNRRRTAFGSWRESPLKNSYSC